MPNPYVLSKRRNHDGVLHAMQSRVRTGGHSRTAAAMAGWRTHPEGDARPAASRSGVVHLRNLRSLLAGAVRPAHTGTLKEHETLLLPQVRYGLDCDRVDSVSGGRKQFQRRYLTDLSSKAKREGQLRLTLLSLGRGPAPQLEGSPMSQRRPWQQWELDLLRTQYADAPTKKLSRSIGRSQSAVYGRAAILGLKKSDTYLAGPDACRLRRGDNVGAARRYLPGRIRAAKGLRRPGFAPGRMAQTQFKPGARPHTWKPIGTTRLSKDGYLQRKVLRHRLPTEGTGSASTS